MIVGIGMDLIEVGRIDQTLQKIGDRFIQRIAHPADLKYAPKKNVEQKKQTTQYWASRFAAKEAFAKALGTGIGAHLRWKWIGVKKNSLGKPEIELTKKVQNQLRSKNITCIHLTLSHTKEYACAMVVLESEEQKEMRKK